MDAFEARVLGMDAIRAGLLAVRVDASTGERWRDRARRPDVPVSAVADALHAAGVAAPMPLVDRVVTDLRYEGYVVRSCRS
jgi:hypothetical protein